MIFVQRPARVLDRVEARRVPAADAVAQVPDLDAAAPRSARANGIIRRYARLWRRTGPVPCSRPPCSTSTTALVPAGGFSTSTCGCTLGVREPTPFGSPVESQVTPTAQDEGRFCPPEVDESALHRQSGGGGRVRTVIEHVSIPTEAGTFDAIASGPEDGRPVLLLHGFPEAAIEWEHQVAVLGVNGFRAVAPDQRGYSPGVRPEQVSEYAVTHLVGDVIAMADALGWSTFDLVGHDWGGAVAWWTADRPPGPAADADRLLHAAPRCAQDRAADRRGPAHAVAVHARLAGAQHREAHAGQQRPRAAADVRVAASGRRTSTSTSSDCPKRARSRRR